MTLLLAPDMSDMPALSRGSTLNDSSTNSSGASSGLFTPDDVVDEPSYDVFFTPKLIHNDDTLSTPRPPYRDGEHLSSGDGANVKTTKLNSWSRAVAKAKKLAGKTLQVRRALRKVPFPSPSQSVGIPTTSDQVRRLRTELTSSQDLDMDIVETEDAMNASYDIPREAEGINDSKERPSGQSVVYETLSAKDEQSAAPNSRRSGAGVREAELDLSTEYLLPEFSSPSSSDALSNALQGPWSARRVVLTIIRILFFLPWSIAVGGAILLSPKHLELITFSPGYLASERGARRFAHWADTAVPHIVIFLAPVAVLMWWNLSIGALVAAAILAGFVYAWHDFHVDLSVPLGEDDRQSIYLAVTKMYLREGFTMRVPMRSDDGRAGE
ncbi:uncharacterized protein LAESUDRAFT_750764 [Laetiporus sulphureus 93-53]|uniref:PRA1 family protein n=1 Tax=Laetiporus sulphureus 93-53 TaxID=1314785 RepID=A0A165DK15_9APHY|nr:uncharacterized protein LAESUDRAFT_750764 [Laetiporus sulphureus 93-53]KZT05054.1 hypothetical protein LAESUDRAFT_750764 [Laetiporus sulphureus 93-53]